MRKLNWTEVEAATGSTRLDPGAYVIEIVNTVDNEKDEYIEIVFDIAEGEKAGLYKDMSADDDWKHRFNQSYSEKAEPFFKRFLDELEHDNANFTIDSWMKNGQNPSDFIGLKLGVVFGEYRYIGNDGKAKWNVRADRPVTIAEVNAGGIEPPQPTYSNRTTPEEWSAANNDEATTNTSDTYDDIPFTV